MSASIIASVLNHPNRRSEGRFEKTVTISPQDSTTDVKIRAGPIRTVARSTLFSTVARLFLLAHAVKKMDRRAQAQPERNGEGDYAGELQSVAEYPQQCS
jgi:hypothetical protein